MYTLTNEDKIFLKDHSITECVDTKRTGTHISIDVVPKRGESSASIRVQKKQMLKQKFCDYTEPFLGTCVNTTEIQRTSFGELERDEKRPGLYAVVMPAGHGKSTYSNWYGFIDIDECVDDAMHELLVAERADLLSGKTNDWVSHNMKWYDAVNNTLDLIHFEKGKNMIILVHTMEMAKVIGAQPVIALALEKKAFEENIQYRSDASKAFSRKTVNYVYTRSRDIDVTFCDDNARVEAILLQLAFELGIECGGCQKYNSENEPEWGFCCPQWILDCDPKGLNLTQIISLGKVKGVPKGVVDSLLKTADLPVIDGFGFNLNDWVKVLAKISGAIPYDRVKHEYGKNTNYQLIYPPRSKLEAINTNVRLDKLMDKLNLYDNAAVRYILDMHRGAGNNFVCQLITHWISVMNGHPLAASILPMYGVEESKWVSTIKELHNAIRISDTFCTYELSEYQRQSIMYMNMLYGKYNDKVDPEEILKERSEDEVVKTKLSLNPTTRQWDGDQYDIDFDQSLSEAMANMRVKPHNVGISSFMNFWDRRRDWLTPGSLGYNELDKKDFNMIVETMDQTYEAVLNKKALGEMVNIQTLFKSLKISHFNATRLGTKPEAGAIRGILPGSLLHYICFSYILTCAEKQEAVGTTRLNAEDSDDMSAFDMKMQQGIHHLLYDWKNFNAQHSSKDMSKVIEKLGTSFSAGADYSMFCHIVAESMYDMKLIHDGNECKIYQGLMSGWRGTTWINTVLNYCYIAIAVKCLARLDKPFYSKYVDQGGDDVDMALNTPECAVVLIHIMEKIGFAANKIKQMVGTRAEFFRNTITSDGVYGNPTRALANYLSGAWESRNIEVRERVSGLIDQIAKLKRRGVDEKVCDALLGMATEHWCKIKAEVWTSMPKEIIHGRTLDGGFGIPDSEGMIWTLKTPFEICVDQDRYRPPGFQASEEYVNRVDNELFASHGIRLEDKKRLSVKLAWDNFRIAQKVEDDWMTALEFKSEVVSKRLAVMDLENYNIFARFMEFIQTSLAKDLPPRHGHFEELKGYMKKDDIPVGEDYNKYFGMDQSQEYYDFKPDIHYQNLVPEYVAKEIKSFCLYNMLYGGLGNEDCMTLYAVVANTYGYVFCDMC